MKKLIAFTIAISLMAQVFAGESANHLKTILDTKEKPACFDYYQDRFEKRAQVAGGIALGTGLGSIIGVGVGSFLISPILIFITLPTIGELAGLNVHKAVTAIAGYEEYRRQSGVALPAVLTKTEIEELSKARKVKTIVDRIVKKVNRKRKDTSKEPVTYEEVRKELLKLVNNEEVACPVVKSHKGKEKRKLLSRRNIKKIISNKLK